MDPLLSEIDKFLIAHPELSEWQFGELALSDRKFIGQLREGRDIRRSTDERVRRFIADYPPAVERAA